MASEGRAQSWIQAATTTVALVGLVSSCTKEHPDSQLPASRASHAEFGPISAIEPPRDLDGEHVALGQELFNDRRLSSNNEIACSSCHDLTENGADRAARSVGVTGESLSLNTPTVFNAGLNFRQFWDGRATTLEQQTDGPLLSDKEMGSTWPRILTALRADTAFSERFSRNYSDGLNEDNVRHAIATFERSLATPDAPFDQFLSGNVSAIGSSARRGYDLFTSSGCSSCHQGRGIGGNMFQKLGVIADYFGDRGHETSADQGRFNVTHDEADRHVFKVPSLRNIARTAPYLHDGSAQTLDETVRVMARYQLGRDLEDADVAALVAFLESLTGVYRGRPL